MTSNYVTGPAVLNFTIFLNSQEITGIKTKSSHNAHEMYKLTNVYNLMKKTGKKQQNYLKKVDFLTDLHEI